MEGACVISNCDVNSRTQDLHIAVYHLFSLENCLQSMEKTPSKCVVERCYSTWNLQEGKVLHIVPFDGTGSSQSQEKNDLRPKDFAVLIMVVFAVTVGSGASGLK